MNQNNDTPISVIGTGVCTPLGINTAMMSAGIALKDAPFQEVSVLNQNGEPVRASILQLIEQNAARTERICFLAASAVQEAMATTPLPDTLESIDVFMGLPEQDETLDYEQIKSAIQAASAFKLNFSDKHLFSTGRSAFFHAVDAAKKALNSGDITYALVGSADSLCDPESLSRFVNQNRLLNANIDGLLTGEGAAFFLFTSNPSETHLIHVALSQEPNHFGHENPGFYSCLSKVFETLRKHPLSGEKRVDYIFTSQTGEDYWNREFTSAYLRNTDLMPEPIVAEPIVESHGDIGAATGSIMLAAAIHKKEDRQPVDRSDRVLLYGSSDNGSIGAAIVEGCNKQRPMWFESEPVKNHPNRDDFFEEYFNNHLEEIGWLIASRHRELHLENKSWTAFSKVEKRLALHLDAVLAGDHTAREHASQKLDDIDNDIVSGAVYSLAALAESPAERDGLLYHFANSKTDMTPVWTLALKHSETFNLDTLPDDFTAGLSENHQVALTEIMAYRGCGDKAFLISQLSGENQSARNYAATALARMNIPEAKTLIESIPQSQWSLDICTALAAFDTPNTLEKCRQALQSQSIEGSNLMQFIALSGSEIDGKLLLSVENDTSNKMIALGTLGLGKFIPVLIEALSSQDPERKIQAAVSLQRITSAGLSETKEDPEFDPEIDDEPEFSPEISEDAETWNRWYQENKDHFKSDIRHRHGKPFSLSACLFEIENPSTPYDIRQLAAMELNVRSGRNVHFEADAFEHRQMESINLWKQGK